MSLHIDFDSLWDNQTQKQIESALRICIGDPLEGGDRTDFLYHGE